MSNYTLGRKGAINVFYEQLPTDVATPENTLHLYQINPSTGGESYTKAESDARFVNYGPSNQTITGEVTASSLRSGQFVVNDGAFTTTITQNTGKGSNTLLKLPRMASDSEFLVNNPFAPQTVSIFNINNSLKIRDSSTLYQYTILGGAATSNRICTIPDMAGDGEFIMTKPTTEQTISRRLTSDLGLRSSNLELFSSVYTNAVTITSQNVSGTKQLYIPNCNNGATFLMNSANPTQTVAQLAITNLTTDSAKLNNNAILKAKYSSGGLMDVWIPIIGTNNAEIIVTSPGSAQTINNALTLTGAVTATAFGTNGSVRISDVTIMSSNVSGAKNIFIPNLGASNGKFIVSDGAIGQVINGLLNVQDLGFTATADTFNRGVNVIATVDETTTGTIASSSAVCNWTKNYAVPKTDIVTTVTGVSDSKVPSDKAVKTYVDSHNANTVQKYSYIVGTGCDIPSDYLYSNILVTGTKTMEFKVVDVTGTVTTRTMVGLVCPVFTLIRVQIDGIIKTTTHSKVLKQNFKIDCNGSDTITLEAPAGGSWNDYDINFPHFTMVTGATRTVNFNYATPVAHDGAWSFHKITVYYEDWNI